MSLTWKGSKHPPAYSSVVAGQEQPKRPIRTKPGLSSVGYPRVIPAGERPSIHSRESGNAENAAEIRDRQDDVEFRADDGFFIFEGTGTSHRALEAYEFTALWVNRSAIAKIREQSVLIERLKHDKALLEEKLTLTQHDLRLQQQVQHLQRMVV
ncbi:hypothetical protein AaE_007091 [Aphanomyces astaci]|uniref:Uncharacterized protein n=1 Tax=Aphanomyces astaci TaxID=112090 RepID=A0A6A5AFH0_APHAT|nr:hypothetical protein AaE_007091 [Aphanomyces astaci]